jgi:adenylosuccinate lyase
MIKRYATKDMTRIWSDQNRFETWKNVEIAVSEVLSEMGKVPVESLKVIKDKAAFSVDRINEIEAETHHDVIAFLTN